MITIRIVAEFEYGDTETLEWTTTADGSVSWSSRYTAASSLLQTARDLAARELLDRGATEAERRDFKRALTSPLDHLPWASAESAEPADAIQETP